MKRRTEVRLEMGRRALEFSLANPYPSQGYANAVSQLQEQLARARQLGEEQRRGLAEVRAATIEKDRIRRPLRRGDLTHLALVAQRASADNPELAQKFDLPRMPSRGFGFRAAARTMVDLVEQHKELLSKYGLVEDTIQKARKALDQLDALAERTAQGRRVHIGASAALEVVGDEVVQLVRILDGFNRSRFGNDGEPARRVDRGYQHHRSGPGGRYGGTAERRNDESDRNAGAGRSEQTGGMTMRKEIFVPPNT